MYGIVNLAIEDLVVSNYGKEVWLTILENAKLTSIPTFVTTEQYPDQVTYQLVGAFSKTLNVSPSEALRLFGRHWIMYTADNGFGDLIKFGGASVRELLGNVDVMHGHVAALMPGVKTPTIDVEDVEEGQFLLHYRSRRQGLAPMVVGLLEGIGELFDEQLEVQHVEQISNGADHDVFAVRMAVMC